MANPTTPLMAHVSSAWWTATACFSHFTRGKRMRDKNAADVQPTGDSVCILAGKNGRKKASGAFVNKRIEPGAAADGPPHFGSHSIKASGGGAPQSRSFGGGVGGRQWTAGGEDGGGV